MKQKRMGSSPAVIQEHLIPDLLKLRLYHFSPLFDPFLGLRILVVVIESQTKKLVTFQGNRFIKVIAFPGPSTNEFTSIIHKRASKYTYSVQVIFTIAQLVTNSKKSTDHAIKSKILIFIEKHIPVILKFTYVPSGTAYNHVLILRYRLNPVSDVKRLHIMTKSLNCLLDMLTR